jgi:hypothetical protein
MQTQFKPGDLVDVEIYTGRPILPDIPEIPMVVRGRIVKLCRVIRNVGGKIDAAPGALIEPDGKRPHEAVPLKHIRPAA